MAKMTPSMNATGKYKVKLPFKINENAVLTCIAIRDFDDIYSKNEDVYEVYYETAGLTNGTVVDQQPFDFERERLLNPNIITLSDVTGALYYIPDTFILSMPAISDVPYSERILSVSLGPMPDMLDVNNVKAEMTELVKSKTGMTTVVVHEHSLALLENPTYDEHLAMERVRKASLQNSASVYERLARAEAEVTRLNALVAKYETTLKK